MENLATDLVSLLQYLIPGFLAAWIFHGLTSHPRPSQFDQIVQALIFTIIVQAGVYGLQHLAFAIGGIYSISKWTDEGELLASIAIAGLLGVGFAHFANNDRVHALIRRIGITRETSYPSEWFGEFSKKVTYVVLHLSDERRIYGWPREWPSSPNRGHFVLQDVSWLEDDSEIRLTRVESVLIKAEDVRWVEFMDMTQETSDEQEAI